MFQPSYASNDRTATSVSFTNTQGHSNIKSKALNHIDFAWPRGRGGEHALQGPTGAMDVVVNSVVNRQSRWSYTTVRDYKFTVHYQFGTKKGRHCEFWLLPITLEDSEDLNVVHGAI